MAPTEKTIKCQLCNFSREVQGPADEKGGCPFCGAGRATGEGRDRRDGGDPPEPRTV